VRVLLAGLLLMEFVDWVGGSDGTSAKVLARVNKWLPDAFDDIQRLPDTPKLTPITTNFVTRKLSWSPGVQSL
jgi:hypothetical protein